MFVCDRPLQRPPFSVNFFSYEEVTCIFDYIYSSYMRHYKLYKYIFTPQVRRRNNLVSQNELNQVLLSFVWIIFNFSPVKIDLGRVTILSLFFYFFPQVKLDLSFSYSEISNKDEPTVENFSASGINYRVLTVLRSTNVSMKNV